MKQQRSSEESEPGNGRDAASGETAPDSAQGSGQSSGQSSGPGSIGAPSAPASRTATQGGDTSVAGDGDGGGARTPTSSAPGPEETGERQAGAPAAVHAVGVSIGRTTAGTEEQPEGSDAAAAREEAAEMAGGSTVAAAATAAAGAVPAAETTTSNSAEEAAEAKTVAPAGAAAAAGAPAGATAATKTAATEPDATKTGSASQEAAGTAGAATAGTAASGATATATATVAASPPDSASATEGGAPERPGRVSRPMVVAAAFAGALLLGAPFVVAGAQKDDGKPTRGEAAAAAWKQDGQEGGYVPGTDPAGPDGVRAPGSPQQGVPPVRGDKGPANHVRADAGDGPQPANGSPETERGDGAKGSTGSTGTKDAKGSAGTGGTTDKSGSSAKTPAGTGSEGSAKAPSAETAPQSQPKTTPKAPTVVYSGVSGHECPTQRFQRDGYYSDGKEGWATHSGGFGGYGCAGKYLSMPMSGSSSKDSGGSATWLFDLPASAKKCSISVHVPGSSDIVRVGGDPSYYTVYDRFLPRTNNLVGSFYVNQQDRRGTWYNVPGTFAVDAKKLSVRIHDRGRDSKYEHHAISTIKATCTG